MSYCLGVDIGDDSTSWSRSERAGDAISVVATGEFSSAVGLDSSGVLVVAGADLELDHVATDFVGLLGQSEPVMVGQTPYGVEALIACLIGAAVATNEADTGSSPDVVALVHTDGMDEFRLSLFGEAGRVAGLSAGHVMVMSRSDAQGSSPDGSASAGAATAGWANVPVVPSAGASGTATAAGAGAATAAGVTAAAVHLSADGTASAASALTGPAGSSIGPAGTPAGPAGSSVGPAGTPAGSSVGPAGTSVGPTGSPISSAGPTGTPLDAAADTGSTGSSTVVSTAARARPRWLPVAIGAGVVAVVAVAAVVVATGGDTPPDTADPSTGDNQSAASVADPITTTPTPTTAGTDTTLDTVLDTNVGPAAFDTSAVIGSWESVCEPFIALDGASAGRYVISDAGANQITVIIQGVDYQTPDCSDGGTVEIAQEYELEVLADTTLNGRRALQVISSLGPAFLAVDGDQLLLATGEDAASAAVVIEMVRK